MADYRRMVSYMYQYENGIKKKNVGFVRIETKGGQCKLTLHMQMLGQLDSIFPTYLIQRQNKDLELIYLGDSVLKNQLIDSKLVADERNIMGSGYALTDMGGLLLFLNDKVYFATEWDDKPVVAKEVLEALKPKSKKSTYFSEQKQKVENFREEAQAVMAKEQDRKLEEELNTPSYMLPGGWKMVERRQNDPRYSDNVGSLHQHDSSKYIMNNAEKYQENRSQQASQVGEKNQQQNANTRNLFNLGRITADQVNSGSINQGQLKSEPIQSDSTKTNQLKQNQNQESPSVELNKSLQRKSNWFIADQYDEVLKEINRNQPEKYNFHQASTMMNSKSEPERADTYQTAANQADAHREKRYQEEANQAELYHAAANQADTYHEKRYQENANQPESYYTTTDQVNAYNPNTYHQSVYNQNAYQADEYRAILDQVDEYQANKYQANKYQANKYQANTYPNNSEQAVYQTATGQDTYQAKENQFKEYHANANQDDEYQAKTDQFDEYQTNADEVDDYQANADQIDEYQAMADQSEENQTNAYQSDKYQTNQYQSEEYQAYADKANKNQAATYQKEETYSTDNFYRENTMNAAEYDEEIAKIHKELEYDQAQYNGDKESEAKESEAKEAKHFFDNYPRIYPFEDNEIIHCVKIEPKDIGLLPKEIWPYSNNSFLMHGYYCYHHLIFAKMRNRFGYRYILGVPGIYHGREQFMARMFGFDNFKSIRKRELQQGDFGYWYLPIYL